MLKVYSVAVRVPHKVSVNQSYRVHSFCCGPIVAVSACVRVFVSKRKGNMCYY